MPHTRGNPRGQELLCAIAHHQTGTSCSKLVERASEWNHFELGTSRVGSGPDRSEEHIATPTVDCYPRLFTIASDACAQGRDRRHRHDTQSPRSRQRRRAHDSNANAREQPRANIDSHMC